MALHRAVQRVVAGHSGGSMLGPSRGFQAVARPGPLYNLVSPVVASPPLVLPEHGQLPEDSRVWMDFPRFGIGGAMELMAVPKKKVSRHKKGIRNGPKALKPIPVIVQST
ncbi:uncharacterized protein LOC125316544 isoform X2 [Rhodamnia argentea]|uniref:Large ribosomal subunit protein bL32m n=1 Tax=Rhodamnia argentea TaxID=178133 RepID=A0ABM3HWX6_9MYRT|nr:uncharacterized protein LOC125316544 isoform X2 [Rhodamnia argentea]